MLQLHTEQADSPRLPYQWLRCGECDARVKTPLTLQKDEHAECPRCHHTLITGSRWSLHRCAMIALSILILMPFALGYPLLSIHLLGVKIDASVWQGIWQMGIAGYSYTGFLVLICAVIMPVSFAIAVLEVWCAKLLHLKPRSLLLFLGYIKPFDRNIHKEEAISQKLHMGILSGQNNIKK